MSESWRKKRENESTSSTREKKKEKKGETKRYGQTCMEEKKKKCMDKMKREKGEII